MPHITGEPAHLEDALEALQAAHMKTHDGIIAVRELMSLEGQLNDATLAAKIGSVKTALTHDVPGDESTAIAVDFVPTRRPEPVVVEEAPVVVQPIT